MTHAQMEQYFKSIPISSPFGMGDDDKSLPIGNRFGKEYSTPISQGGKRISRHEMNGLGYLATIGTFLDSFGYQYEWRDLSKLGGYPKGAIVSKVGSWGGLERFVNIEDNNIQPPPFEEDITDESGEVNGWLPLYSTKQYGFFPNYDSKEKIYEYHVTQTLPLKYTTVDITEPGWVLVEREIDNWDEAISAYGSMDYSTQFRTSESNYVSLAPYATSDEQTIYQDAFKIRFAEGEKASRLYPCSTAVSLKAACKEPISGITISVYLFKLE